MLTWYFTAFIPESYFQLGKKKNARELLPIKPLHKKRKMYC